jgi:predicted DNA binding CopG/RHH family protein
MAKPKKSNRKPLPRFASEDAERRFWAKHDVTDYFDWKRAVQPTFPNLKPSTVSISLRLPISLMEELKSLANEKDVPYQSLLKVFLAERLATERTRR